MQHLLRPKAVITVITLLAIITVAYCLYFLFASHLVPGEQLGSYRYNALFGLYVMFLFLCGFYTGRRWTVHLYVVLSIISIIASIIVSFLTGFSIALWIALGAVALKLLITLSLYGASNREWFNACKHQRIQRANAGINGGARVWVICISTFIFIFWAGFLTATLQHIGMQQSLVKGSVMNSRASIAICHRFLTNPRLAPRMKSANIDQQRCEKLMPRQIRRCYKHLAPMMPKNMKKSDYQYWMRKVGQCSGKVFYKKYLANPKRHRSMI
ncbi:MAG: hypothetical protein P1U63_00390 [Coxiellaceae bacterium]|nr:hypothetical protein [Coxiellaceae bacterium]